MPSREHRAMRKWRTSAVSVGIVQKQHPRGGAKSRARAGGGECPFPRLRNSWELLSSSTRCEKPTSQRKPTVTPTMARARRSRVRLLLPYALHTGNVRSCTVHRCPNQYIMERLDTLAAGAGGGALSRHCRTNVSLLGPCRRGRHTQRHIVSRAYRGRPS